MAGRKSTSYVRKHGPVAGPKLFSALQKEAAQAIAKRGNRPQATEGSLAAFLRVWHVGGSQESG